jgi:hypothetical protein
VRNKVGEIAFLVTGHCHTKERRYFDLCCRHACNDLKWAAAETKLMAAIDLVNAKVKQVGRADRERIG